MQSAIPRFDKQGLKFAAVSYDSEEILQFFSDRHNITYPLLADPDSKVIRAYDVLNAEATGMQKGFARPGYFFLDPNGIVIDIGCAHDALKSSLGPLNYRNLDDLPQFKGVNTTTEFLTKYVFDQLADAARKNSLGRAGRELAAIRVTVAESPSARAWYEAPLW